MAIARLSDFGELVADIREQLLLQPIVLHEGRILDGRNRYRACRHGGVEPRFEQWEGESPTAYVLSLNLHRRHLTDGQRAAIAVEAKERLEEEAREAQRQAAAHGREGGRGNRKTLRPDSDEGFPTRPGGRDHSRETERRSDERAAKEVGVSRYAVRQAERVKDADPELSSGSGLAPFPSAAPSRRSSAGSRRRSSRLRSSATGRS